MLSSRKNYIFTLLSGFGGVAISILLNLVTIPISLNYWKADRYAIWVLLTSLLLYLGMTNLGLNTAAAVLMGRNPRVTDKVTILRRSLVILLSSTAVMLAAFLLLNLLTKDWIRVIGQVPDNLQAETLSASVVLVVFFLFSLPFSLLSAVYAGFQKAYIENLFNVVLNIVNFLVLIAVIVLRGNLFVYSLVWGAALVAFNAAKYLYFHLSILAKQPTEERHKAQPLSSDTEYKTIFITGMRFFFMGIAAMIVWNTDNLVISNLLGLQSVAPYFVTFKLFSVVFGVMFQISGSLMPLLAKEYGNGNFAWINDVYRGFLVLMSVAGGATWIGGVLFFRDIVTLWAGAGNYAGLVTVVALGGYSYLLGMSNLNFGVVNTLNYTSIAPLVAWGEAVVKIIVSVSLATRWGFAGVALGTFMGSLCGPTWALPVWIRNRSAGRILYDYPFVTKHFALAVVPCLISSILLQVSTAGAVMRMSVGVFVTVSYLALSYWAIPVASRAFFFRNVTQALRPVGVR